MIEQPASARFLLASDACSQLGGQMLVFAIPWHVFVTTGSVGWMSAFLASESICSAIVALPIGSLVDRAERRRLLVGAELARFAMVALLALGSLHAAAPLPLLFLVNLLIGTVNTLHDTTKMAAVPSLVGTDEAALDAFNVKSRSLVQMGGILGPLVAGLLIDSRGLLYVLGTAVLLFPLAALVASRLPVLPAPAKAPSSEGGVDDGPAAGIRWLRARPLLLSLAGVGALMAAVMPVFVVLWLPAFVKEELGMGGREVGIGRAIAAVSGLLGTIGYGMVASRIQISRIKLIAWAQILFSGVLFGLLAIRTYAALVAVLVIGDAIAGAAIVAFGTIFFQMAPEDARGRIFAAMGAMASAAGPLGMAAAGAIMTVAGWQAMLIVLAAAVGAAGIPLFVLKPPPEAASAPEVSGHA